eukprot:241981-Chlamydomonas_euryale.AAC.6
MGVMKHRTRAQCSQRCAGQRGLCRLWVARTARNRHTKNHMQAMHAKICMHVKHCGMQRQEWHANSRVHLTAQHT